MPGDRRLMYGIPMGSMDELSFRGNLNPIEEHDVPQDGEDVIEFDGERFVPVIARPRWGSTRVGIDRSAEIVTGDVDETMSMSPFDRTQAEYNGVDTRGTPIIDYESVTGEQYQ